jgi:hypothetical protein
VHKNYPGPAVIETCTSSITKISKEIIIFATALKYKIIRVVITITAEDWFQTSSAFFVS